MNKKELAIPLFIPRFAHPDKGNAVKKAQPDGKKHTPARLKESKIMIAASKCDMGTVKSETKASLASLLDREHNTLILICISNTDNNCSEKTRLNFIKFICDDLGCRSQLHAQNKYGITPLMKCIEKEFVEIAKYIVEQNPMDIYTIDNRGHQAIHILIQQCIKSNTDKTFDFKLYKEFYNALNFNNTVSIQKTNAMQTILEYVSTIGDMNLVKMLFTEDLGHIRPWTQSPEAKDDEWDDEL